MASSVQTCTEIPDQCKPLPLCPGCTILVNLTVPCQKYAHWCWAAVAAGIYKFHNGSAIMQCEVASKQKGAGNCCKEPCSKGCSQRLTLEEVLCSVNCLDQGPVPVAATFSFSDLKALFQPPAPDKPRPVCARIQWNGGGGHFVVIKGFQEASQKLLIADPLFYGEHLMAFNDFKGDELRSAQIWTHYYLTDKVNHGNCP